MALKNIFSRKHVSQEERDKRLAICRTCPELWTTTKQCSRCLCFVDLKTWKKKEECPIGKWSKGR